MLSRLSSRYFTMLNRNSNILSAYRELCHKQRQTQVQEENPFLKKYSNQIAAMQNSLPEEYKIRVEKLNQPSAPRSNAKASAVSSAGESKISSSYQNKSLDAIMKLDLLQSKSAEEIESIWKQYHQSKDGLYAILPVDAYQTIYTKLREFPTFLFPLPRAEGYEFILSQHSGNSCHFTPLISYQAYKENAPACLTLTYFAELVETKGIVLMRGEYDTSSLKVHEAQCLTNQLQLYYGGGSEKKERMLWHFNKQPETFKHMDLISELEFGLDK